MEKIKFSLTNKKEKEPQVIKKEIAPGIIKKEIFDIIAFETSRKISGLTYNIEVLHEGDINESSVYNVGFSTKEYGNKITNQGINTYNQIVDAIMETVLFLNKKEGVNFISIEAIKNSFSKEKQSQIIEKLNTEFKNNNNIFNGFHYKNSEDYSFDINNGLFVVTYEKDNNQTVKWKDDVKTTINKLLPEMFNDDIILAILKHIKMNEEIDYIEKKKGGEQRLKLYERTLKKRFPGYDYKIDENKILINLSSLNINSPSATL